MTQKKTPRLRGDERQRMRAQWDSDYRAGATIRALARRSGWSFSTVRAVLLEAKTPLRARGGYRGRGRR